MLNIPSSPKPTGTTVPKRGPNAQSFDVCLVSMPYPVIDQPSVALGILKSALTRRGMSARCFYPCLDFAETIGLDAFALIADSKQEFLIGEWTFAGAAFPDFQPDHDAYLDRVLSAAVSQGLSDRSGFRDDPRAALWAARQAAPAFVDQVAQQVLAHTPEVVGCTSTFFQHCASLALLRRIKELAPEVTTVLGGANCEGAMGIAAKRCFGWVDYVVSGEADTLFPNLCERVLAGYPPTTPEAFEDGVIGRLNHALLPQGTDAPRASVYAMDDVPAPEFDDYFNSLNQSTLAPYISPGLAVETSRGCWWGAKKHCTFCGLNGGNMSFRSKSATRVLDELRDLSERHGVRKFNVVDNILDMKYLRDLLPELARSDPYRLFFETKANLRREQLQIIADAGIRRLQPGIESLHDDILRLIEKGTTGLQNVQLLKWARELGVFITWNFLWDIPGEQDEWYGEMAQWLPRLVHLQPPGIDRIQYHRFSPYHTSAARYGLKLEPFPTYSAVYPLGHDDIHQLAYYFDDKSRASAQDQLAQRPHLKQVMRTVGQWNRLWGFAGSEKPKQRPRLMMQESAQSVKISDTRPCAVEPKFVLTGIDAEIYRLCDGIKTTANLTEALQALGVVHSVQDIDASLARLDAQRLVMLHKNRALALATRGVTRIPDTKEEFPGGTTDVEAWVRQAAAGAFREIVETEISPKV